MKADDANLAERKIINWRDKSAKNVITILWRMKHAV